MNPSLPVRLADTTDTQSRFRELYLVEYPKLAGFAFSLLRDTDRAHDAAQEAFVRLFARLLTVREPRPFLFRVVTNLAHDVWRREALDASRHESLIGQFVAGGVDDRDLAASEDLRRAVGRLPDRLRVVLLLHYYADLSVREVATAVGRPEGTVKRQLAEARSRLAADLGDNNA